MKIAKFLIQFVVRVDSGDGHRDTFIILWLQQTNLYWYYLFDILPVGKKYKIFFLFIDTRHTQNHK